MKPATRFLILGVVAAAVLTAVAAFGTLHQVDHAAHGRLLSRLQVASTVEHELQANRLTELQLRADLLAQDPSFVDYVAQSLIPSPQLGGAVDSASISDLLKERRHGYDIAMVLDPQGKPVASSGILLKDHASIQHDPLVVHAIAQLKPQQGAWVDHGQLLWVTVSPLLRGGAVQGALIAATRVNDAFAIAISRIARTNVALLITPTPGSAPAPSAGLDPWAEQALSAQLPAALGVNDATGQAFELSGGSRKASAWVTPLNTSGGRAALAAVGPDAGTLGLISPSALPLVTGVFGLGACALLLVLLLWWRTWLPLQRMLGVIELAGNGDQHLTIRTGGSSIVRCLREGINPLLRRSR
ncbi:MAG: hypothetical protein ABI268_06090 [Rhodanobacter sp.]